MLSINCLCEAVIPREDTIRVLVLSTQSGSYCDLNTCSYSAIVDSQFIILIITNQITIQIIIKRKRGLIILIIRMDSFSLRMNFRQEIRRRTIEQMKRQRRRVILEENRKYFQEQKTQQLYKQIIRQPNKIFDEPLNYLQILKQALHGPNAHHYGEQYPNVMLSLLKYYETNSLSEQQVILFMECVAMIYFNVTPPFYEITQKMIDISMHELDLHKDMRGSKSKFIKNRCLICLQNMTCDDNQPTLKYCTKEKQLLQNLQGMLQDFPNQSQDKETILKIYGNLINYQIFHNQQAYANFYPNLLVRCFEENYNSDVLEESVNIVCLLIKNKQCNTQQILEEIQCLFVTLRSAKFYVGGTEQLLSTALEYLAIDCSQNKVNWDISEHYRALLDNLVQFYSKQAKPTQICKTFKYLLLLEFKVQSDEFITVSLMRSLFNYWMGLEVQCSSLAELYMLQFLQYALSNEKIIEELHQQATHKMVQERNALNAPTWEIIMEFLKQVDLENPQKMLSFLLIFKSTTMWRSLLHTFAQHLLNKVEGCSYCCDDNVARKAQQILNIHQQAQRMHN